MVILTKIKAHDFFNKIFNKKTEKTVTVFLFSLFLVLSVFQYPNLKSNNPLKAESAFADGVTVQVTAGNAHSCALKSDGTVWCWGGNWAGQVGNNTTTWNDEVVPVQVHGENNIGYLTEVMAISAGYEHTCALKSDGTVWCWGDNYVGDLGNNTTDESDVPVQVHGVGDLGFLSDIKAISSGEDHTCALKNDGTMFCWGDNSSGELGNNTTIDSSIPVQVLGVDGLGFLGNISSIEAAHYYTCAVSIGGDAYCWGYNDDGELGDNTTNESDVPVQVVGVGGIGFLSNIQEISGNDNHTCAVTNDGFAYCWGENYDGDLGIGIDDGNNYLAPMQVLGVGGTGFLSDINSISVGAVHSCALKADGTIYCWGWKEETGINICTWDPQTTPMQVHGPDDVGYLSEITNFDTGDYHAVAVDNNGTVYSWGDGSMGSMGDNAETSKCVPVKAVLATGNAGYLADVSSIGSDGDSTCTVKNDGTVWCWGSGEPVPLQVRGENGVGYLTDVKTISTGNTNHYCVLKTDGTVWCWGSNNYGTLGINSFAIQYSEYPVQVHGVGDVGYLSDVKEINTGSSLTCAVKIDGTLYCWGYGPTGDNTGNARPVPVQVHGVGDIGYLIDVNHVTVGVQNACAVKTDGTVFCWGYNGYGNLGINTINFSDSLIPVQVHGVGDVGYLTDVENASFGYEHVCAVKTDGTLYCWGRGTRGELGNGGVISYSTPVQVLDVGGVGYLSNIDMVSTGDRHSCAKKTDGTLYCWGGNNNGQIGDGTTTNRSVPFQVLGVDGTGVFENASVVNAGSYYNCVLGDDSSVYCWGANYYSQLGNSWSGNLQGQLSPVQVWSDFIRDCFNLFDNCPSGPSPTTTTTTTTIPSVTTTRPATTTTTSPAVQPVVDTTTTTVPDETTTSTTTTTKEETSVTTKSTNSSSNNSNSSNNKHDGFFKTVKSYVVAFLSTSSDAIAKINYKITNYFTSSKGLGNFLGMIPPALARVFPWLLFALLTYLIRRLIKQTKEEGKNAQEMIKLIDLEKAIGVQKENFVRLSSHYLRTPLTIITSGIDLMFTLDKVEKDKQTDLSNALKDLNTKVEEIFTDISSNKYLNEITIPDIKEEKIKVYASPYLWLPIILIGGVALLTNYLFINIAKIDLYTINLLTQVAAFLVLAQLFFSNFRKRQAERMKNQKYIKELKLQKVIDDARNTFMDQVAKDVNEKMIPLETILPSVGTIEHKTEIYHGLSDLKQMIYKFTLIGSIKSADAVIRPRELNLSLTISEYIKARQEDINSKNLKVKISKKDMNITTDKDKFLFVIFSIIDNAIKFSKDNGTINISWEGQPSQTIITVEDNGIGMTNEAKDLLFKPFVRGTSTLRFDYEGMGTNLYIAKQISNYLNGDISIESEIDKGTKAVLRVGKV